MGWFGRSDQAPPGGGGPLPAELEALRAQRDEARARLKGVDSDTAVLLRAVETLAPGQDLRSLSYTLMELCTKPLDLAVFYVAQVDWEADQVHFDPYWEGGKVRNVHYFHPNTRTGLTGRTIHNGGPLYVPTQEEGEALGTVLTEAERKSGLIPETWYSEPLGDPARPWGVLCFQSYKAQAYSEARRRIMSAIARVLEMAAKAPTAP